MFALDLPTIRAVKAYYARRAAEYDATSWEAFDETERATVERFVASLPPGRILDIGCGTGYLTRFLRGSVVGVDQSAEVLELVQARVPGAELVCAEVPPLPFADGAFDLAFSSNVYSHIDTAAARAEFVAETLRVARALVVLEQSWRPGRKREAWELRRLLDGSEYRVFKRYLTAEELARELEGVVVFASAEFVAVRTPLWQLSLSGARTSTRSRPSLPGADVNDLCVDRPTRNPMRGACGANQSTRRLLFRIGRATRSDPVDAKP